MLLGTGNGDLSVSNSFFDGMSLLLEARCGSGELLARDPGLTALGASVSTPSLDRSGSHPLWSSLWLSLGSGPFRPATRLPAAGVGISLHT